MLRPILPLVFCLACCGFLPAAGDWDDCVWGGSNEETSYSPVFCPDKGGVTLAQYQPSMNLGAPQPAIPVQATPQTQAMQIPQTHMPTITIPSGPVGSVGQPATFSDAAAPGSINLVPGAEIVYIIPSSLPSQAEICVDGVKTIPAAEAKVVPANTPGAIPAMLKTVTVRRPKVEYHWAYGRVETKTETLVQVVDSRTNRVVRSYCQEDTDRTLLPWLHRREVTTYEMVEAKIAVPISVAPAASSTVNTVILGGGP